MLWDGYTMARARRARKSARLGAGRRADRRAGLLGGYGGAGRTDGRARPQIRFARLFRCGVFRPHHGGRAGRKIDGEFADQPVRRPAGGDGRHRQHLRHRPVFLRRADPARRRSTGRGSGRHVRPRRGPDPNWPGSAHRTAERDIAKSRDAVPDPARTAGDQDHSIAQHGSRHRAGNCARCGRHDHRIHRLRYRKAIRQAATTFGNRGAGRHRRAADRGDRVGRAAT